MESFSLVSHSSDQVEFFETKKSSHVVRRGIGDVDVSLTLASKAGIILA